MTHRSSSVSTARPEARRAAQEGIVDVADELDAPVIVIGSRGLSGLKEILAVPPPRTGR